MQGFANDSRAAWTAATAFLAALLLLVVGCDNSVNVLDRETGLYSIYGALDVDADVNFIRVKDLNAPLVEDSTRSLEATVTLENLRTGTTEVLRDSVAQFETVNTHNFRTSMDIEPTTGYRVTVEHPDGRTAQATAHTPPIAETTVGPKNEDCNTPIRVTFEPVESPDNVDPEIGFEYGGETRWTPAFSPRIDDSNPDRAFLQFTPKQVLDAFFKPNEMLNRPEVWCHELDDDELTIRYYHYGSDFFGDTPSDSLNVPGGIGRFGGFYDDSFSFPIDTVNVCAPLC